MKNVSSDTNGQMVKLAVHQRSEAVQTNGIQILNVAVILATMNMSSRLSVALAFAPLIGIVLKYLLGSRWPLKKQSLQHSDQALVAQAMAPTARDGGSSIRNIVAIISVNFLLIFSYFTSNISSLDAFGLLPMAGAVCIILFNLCVVDITPARMSMMAGATSIILLVQLCIKQSLIRSIFITAIFVLIWVALSSRRAPAIGSPISERKRNSWAIRHAAATAGRTMAIAFPLMVALFFLFPRIPIELLRSGAAETNAMASVGLSNSLTLGSISQLKSSQDPAFRATFNGQAPKDTSFYWRAMVLDKLEGQTWVSSVQAPSIENNATLSNKMVVAPGQNLYTAIWDPQNNNSHPVVLDGTIGKVLIFHNAKSSYLEPRLDGTYALAKRDPQEEAVSPSKINNLSGVMTESILNKTNASTTMSVEEKQFWTKLPEKFNPLTQEYGKDLRKRFVTDEKIVSFFLKKMNEENYHYTLRPPKLGYQAIDDFLFDTKSGFCEHYASAFVVTLRGAGIPARLISGYLSGGATRASVNVSQGDAHAWAEIWLDNKGWVRQDPTASISPNRVDPDAANARLESTPDGFFGFMELNWNQYTFKAEKSWRENVLGFDADEQEKVFKRAGMESASKLLILVCSAILLLVAAMFWKYFRVMTLALLKPQVTSQLSGLLRTRCLKFKLERGSGQTWREVAAQAGKKLDQRSAGEFNSIVDEYEKLTYSGQQNKIQQKLLAKRINSFVPVRH